MIDLNDCSGAFKSVDGKRWVSIFGGGSKSFRFDCPGILPQVDAMQVMMNAAQAYNQGFEAGQKAGRVKLQQEFRALFDASGQ